MKVKKGQIFDTIQQRALPRNTFDLTHQHATTIGYSSLAPVCVMEAIPGDIWDITSDTFIRLQPMITPMMHRSDFTMHYFFVPNRILWPGWEDFITGNLAVLSGMNQPPAPFFTAAAMAGVGADAGKALGNYMGMEISGCNNLVNAGFGTTFKINALPFAAYNKIWWDYYVPKELLDSNLDFTPLANGINDANVATLTQLLPKGWIRDYFTSALPYAQKGEAVSIPLGDFPETRVRRQQNPGDGASFIIDGISQPGATAGTATALNAESDGQAPTVLYIPETPMGNTTINDLRRAMRLQEWLEKNARAGTRYVESLQIHFDVNPQDARLQRAEYITGIKSPIIVSEVLNTAGVDGGLPQGNMAGHGIGIGNSYRDKYYCQEHGWIIGLLSVTPRPAYTSGIPKFLSKRFDQFDYYWHDFANIGEQAIERSELQTRMGPGLEPDDVFGYIPRYAEYKFKNDMITGDFADAYGAEGNLRTWVMQRKFGTPGQPGYGNANLNLQFITGDIQAVASAPFAVLDTPIMVQQLNKLMCSRQMPVYGTPSF